MMNITRILSAFLLWACVYLRGISLADLRCDVICDEEGDFAQPLCGEDGVTYASKCEFGNAVCRAAANGTRLGVAYEGGCVTTSTPCSDVQGRRCSSSHSVNGYVCGTDGFTYKSECFLVVAHCKSLEDPSTPVINLDYKGPCEKRFTNESRLVDCGQYVEGSSGAIAIEGGASITVQIKTCTKEYNPVCSLEGRSYSNQCSFCRSLALQHKISTSNMTAYIAHNGTCYHAPVIG